jgi:hypothetical protein
MTMLVTLEQAKRHLYIDIADTDRDADIMDKVEEASAAVISYLKDSAQGFLDSSGLLGVDSSGQPLLDSPGVVIPFQVRAATLQLLTALFENRGDDGGAMSKFEQGYLPPAVTALLYPLRDPALA